MKLLLNLAITPISLTNVNKLKIICTFTRKMGNPVSDSFINTA